MGGDVDRMLVRGRVADQHIHEFGRTSHAKLPVLNIPVI